MTRDRLLAGRAPRAVLLRSTSIADQWRAVRREFPELPTDVRFERCTECNGELDRVLDPRPEDRTEGVPWDRVRSGLPLYRCTRCSHYYWEGSHTSDIRARIRRWESGGDV